jgi:hypothetical protein
MKHKKMSFEDGKSFVKKKRPMVHPNSGFIQQLQQYEEQLLQRKQVPH